MSSEPRAHGEADLGRCIREVAEFLAAEGDVWGEPPRMFALVRTALLAEADPALLDSLDDAGLTPVEQEPLYDDAALHPAALGEILSGVSWPDSVTGCLLVREIVVLPPGADAADSGGHPQRTEARLYAAALRGGGQLALLQLRAQPGAGGGDAAGGEDEVRLLRYEGLGENLLAALHATFDADAPPDDGR